jgi:hypothetical protein
MFELNREVFIVILIALLLLWVIRPFSVDTRVIMSEEGFNANGTAFVPEGSDRYGLRGDLLRRSDIAGNFIRPDRNVVLNHSGGEMYVSDYTPAQEGREGCFKVPCTLNPPFGPLDKLDVCWKCSTGQRKKSCIPSIHPHA